jgi:predicted nucleic acid-binding protein
MIAAVDTNIILDVLIPDEPFGQSSRVLLDHYISRGQLVICEVVYAELASMFRSEDQFARFLAETGIRLISSNARSLYLAGVKWTEYARKSGKGQMTCANCGKTGTMPPAMLRFSRKLRVLGIFSRYALHAECILSAIRENKGHFKDLQVVRHCKNFRQASQRIFSPAIAWGGPLKETGMARTSVQLSSGSFRWVVSCNSGCSARPSTGLRAAVPSRGSDPRCLRGNP